ncbi:MAG TPA: hypothetical protein VHI13_21695 [Candidatus Kapabacteria bacterium]|nr:hypothetical protein [Candidatus Kapabacteria bacterium]
MMAQISVHTALAMTCLCVAILAAGCGMGTLSAVNGSTLITEKLDLRQKNVIPVGYLIEKGTAYLVQYRSGVRDYDIACFDTSMNRRWLESYDIQDLTDDAGLRDYGVDRHSVVSVPGRIDVVALAVKTPDSAAVILRQLDAVTGKTLTSRCLARYRSKLAYGPGYVRFDASSDGERCALTYRTGGDDSAALHVALYDRDLRRTADLLVSGSDVDTVALPNEVLLPADGRLILGTRRLCKLALTEIDRSSGREIRSITMSADYPDKHATAGCVDSVLIAPGDSQLVVISRCTANDGAPGILLSRIRLRTLASEFSAMATTSELRRGESIAGISVLPMFSRIIDAGGAAGRYVVTLEQQGGDVRRETNRTELTSIDGKKTVMYHSDVIPSAVTGDYLVIACDDRGNVAWKQTIAKNQGGDWSTFDLIAGSAGVTPDGRLRAVYRQGDGMQQRTFRLADGMVDSTASFAFLDVGSNVGVFGSTVAWSDNRTVFFIAETSVIGHRYYACRAMLPR